MTIEELHVGIDLGVQRLDSNVFGSIQKPEKDYYINSVTDELLRAVVLSEKNTVFSLLTYGDINEWYEACQAHIIRVELDPVEQLGQGYYRCTFPQVATDVDINSGNLVAGVTYEIIVAGTSDLSGFGYNTYPPVVGNTFVCTINNLVSPTISLRNGGIYKIINSGNIDFTGLTYGADSNKTGTIFTMSGDAVINSSSDVELEVIEASPVWSKTELRVLGTTDYYLYIRSDSHTETGGVINKGNIYRGNRYIVTKDGNTPLDLFGGYDIYSAGSYFTCTASGTPTWDNLTTLKLLKGQPNRLLKEQDVRNALTNSFGTVITSPIATIRDYGLDVYNDNKFDISMVEMSYIRKPVSVSYDKDITSDLPESIHAKLVSLVVQYIGADIGSPNYQLLKDKNTETKINN